MMSYACASSHDHNRKHMPRRRQSRDRRDPSSARKVWWGVATIFAGVGLFVLVLREQQRDASAEDFLAEKDRLIETFRGFNERAMQREQQATADLSQSFPDLTSVERLAADSAAFDDLGSENVELLARRRAELVVDYVPTPDDDILAVRRRLDLLRASERQWRELFDAFVSQRRSKLGAAAGLAGERRRSEARAAVVRAAAEQKEQAKYLQRKRDNCKKPNHRAVQIWTDTRSPTPQPPITLAWLYG